MKVNFKPVAKWLNRAFTDTAFEGHHTLGSLTLRRDQDEGWKAGHDGLSADVVPDLPHERREAWLE